MAITSEYNGGYEVKNIIPKAVYNTQTIITDSFEIVPEDKKSIFSLYFLDGYKTAIKVYYCLSADNLSFSDYMEVIEASTLGNYIFFYTNTDINGYLKFKIEITGHAVMEFNKLGVLKGVRTRSFILLEGANEHKVYQCYENLAIGDPAKLVNFSGTLKAAKLCGNNVKSEVELYNNGALPQTEILGNTVIFCYRDFSTNILMLKYGTINYDNNINWNSPFQVYSTALMVSSQIRTFSIRKLSESKFAIAFVCTGGNAYVIGGDVVNGVAVLGTAASAGTVSTSNPFCNIFRLTEGKFILCSFAAGVNYAQYRCICITQSNTFTLGNNYSPVSSSAISINGCVINENDPAGVLFAVGINFTSSIGLYSNCVSGTSSVTCEASTSISTSASTISEFSVDPFSISRGFLSYTVDDTTHKLTVRFFNITKTSIVLSDLSSSAIDANNCTVKILSQGKIVHVYSYTSASKIFYVVSDLTQTGITWGSPMEILTGASTSSFNIKAVSGTRYVIVYCNETSHSVKYKVFEDDRGLFLGIMNENSTAGNFAEVKTIGQLFGKSAGLVPGEQLFIQNDGSIGNQPSGFQAGIALSDTEILIRR